MSTLGQDKTTSRVALCSAIFAGFAYVGYAVVRQAFGGVKSKVGGKSSSSYSSGFFRNDDDLLGLDYEQQPRHGHKVYLRRLSGPSTSSLEEDGLRCVLRPLSVRERIRELNLNAVAFADTMLVLHGKKAALHGPRSLQCSPFHSPTRILSPLDLQSAFLQHDLARRDTEDSITCSTPRLSRWGSRRSLGRRSMTSSVVNLTEGQQEEADARAETLLHDKEEELTRRMEGFQSSRPRELTPYEARSLVALLHSSDKEKIRRTLVTISNCAAFTRNQDSLREAGVLVRLPALLAGPDREVQLAAVMAAANLALNTGNMKEMEQATLVMVLLADDTARASDPELLLQLLLALTNLAVLSDWHLHLTPLLPRLLALWLQSHHPHTIRLQATRLLINLACSEETIPHLLSVKLKDQPLLCHLLDPGQVAQDQLLRSVTLLANLAMAAQRQGLVGEQESLQGALFSTEKENLVTRAEELMRDQEGDVRAMARKLHVVLAGLGGYVNCPVKDKSRKV